MSTPSAPTATDPARPPYSAPPEATPITLRDFVRPVRRHALLSLVTFALTVTATMAVTAYMPRTYEATTSLILDNTPSGAVPNNFAELLGGRAAPPGEVEIAKILSRNFLTEVITKARAEKVTTVDDIRGRIEVTISPSGQILTITAKMKNDPVLTARVANTVANIYKENLSQEAARKTNADEIRLRRQKTRAEKDKDEAQQALFVFTKKRGTSDPGYYYMQRAHKASDSKGRLEDLVHSLPVKQQNIELYQNQVNTVPSTVVANTSQNRNGQIEEFQARITNYKAQRTETLQDFGPESPEVRNIDTQIAATEAAIKQLQANAYTPGSVGIVRNPDYAAAQSNLLAAKHDLAQTEKQIAAEHDAAAAFEKEQQTLAPESVRFNELSRRVQMTSDSYAKLSNALLAISLNRTNNVPNITILNPARVPLHPVSPKPWLNLLMALFGGIVAAVVAAVAAEYFGNGAAGSGAGTGGTPLFLPEPPRDRHLPDVGGVPLLARVPLTPERAFPAPAGAGLPARASAATEDAFREIGYLLSHSADANPARVPVVLMAGTRTDDTVASVAAYLAATLVRDGVRVTLVDGDRADPRLHRVFGKDDAPGVTDVVAGRASRESALHIGAQGNLRFLAAGARGDAAPSEESLRRLYDDLGQPADTDLVLISGPSVWSARLVAPMERAADGVVLVTSDAQVAPDESVARARRILTNGQAPRLLGVIVGEEAVPAALPSV